MELRAAAEVPHRLAQLRLDDRVDDDRGPALRAVDDEAEVVHRLDARMPDLLERLLGELRLERGDEPRGGLAGRVRDDVELDGRNAHRSAPAPAKPTPPLPVSSVKPTLMLALRSIQHTCTVRILVVDDERAVREALQRALRLEGYEVELATDGQEALFALARHGVDAIVLDVLMPVMDGLETARKLRRQGNSTPILMLTARHEVSDRVAGLDAGADDYLVKPFALEELLARLRALLRRSAGGDELLSFGDLTLDPGTREVRRGDRPIELTRTEFLLLELFLRNPRQVLTRDVIFDRVWGYDFGPASNSLEVYVGYLRRKTEAEGEPRLIHTVRGVGYALREDGA